MRFRLAPDLSAADAERADALADEAPNAHYTQHPAWAGVARGEGPGRPLFLLGEEGARLRVFALVRRRGAAGLGAGLADVFRGPMADSPAALLEGIDALAEALGPRRLLALRVDPYWHGPGGDDVRRGLAERGYAPMAEPPWHVRSLEVTLPDDEQSLLQSFRPATRRQVRKALRMDLAIREDLDDAGLRAFQGLYSRMSREKGAAGRTAAFFKAMRDLFRAWPHRGFFLSSWRGEELLAAISVFRLGRRALYACGASSLDDPTVPKAHRLHFEAMRRASALGCSAYDLGGYSHPQGAGPAGGAAIDRINYFKSGFGGTTVDFVGGHERVLRPVRYRLARSIGRLIPRPRRGREEPDGAGRRLQSDEVPPGNAR